MQKTSLNAAEKMPNYLDKTFIISNIGLYVSGEIIFQREKLQQYLYERICIRLVLIVSVQ